MLLLKSWRLARKKENLTWREYYLEIGMTFSKDKPDNISKLIDKTRQWHFIRSR